MKSKKNKKRKIGKILIIILIIGLIACYLFTVHIKNIYIKGNKLLSDYEIIELAGIKDYPRLFSISSSSMISKIKVNPYVESVKISKNLFGRVDIVIKEYNILLKNELDNTIYLSSLKNLPNESNIVGVPTLINEVPEDILKAFLKKLNTIDLDIVSKISEVKYSPNNYDKDLFLFYMNDGNYVYITTTRLNNISKYDEVLASLDGKKGILYLDSGNHFQVLE